MSLDVGALEKQLADVQEKLAAEPDNATYADLKRSLEEALELAKDSDDDSSDDDDDDDDEAGEGDKGEGAQAEQDGRGDATAAVAASSKNTAQAGSSSAEAKPEAPTEALTEAPKRAATTATATATTTATSRKRRRVDLSHILPGAVCEVLNDGTGVWNSAVLERYGDETTGGKVAVRFLHASGDVRFVDSDLVRALTSKVKFDTTKLQIGLHCLAKFSGDGKTYKGVVLRVTKRGCMVRFQKYDNEEEVAFQHIKLVEKEAAPDTAVAAATAQDAPAPTTMNLAASIAEIPKHLLVKESDSDKIKEGKRRALKKLKKQTITAQKELVADKKQAGWKSFQAKRSKKKTKR